MWWHLLSWQGVGVVFSIAGTAFDSLMTFLEGYLRSFLQQVWHRRRRVRGCNDDDDEDVGRKYRSPVQYYIQKLAFYVVFGFVATQLLSAYVRRSSQSSFATAAPPSFWFRPLRFMCVGVETSRGTRSAVGRSSRCSCRTCLMVTHCGIAGPPRQPSGAQQRCTAQRSYSPLTRCLLTWRSPLSGSYGDVTIHTQGGRAWAGVHIIASVSWLAGLISHVQACRTERRFALERLALMEKQLDPNLLNNLDADGSGSRDAPTNTRVLCVRARAARARVPLPPPPRA